MQTRAWPILVAVALLGCGATGPIPEATGLPGGEDQRPLALDGDTLEAWLNKGLYKAWRCEPKPDTSRQGAHSANRICSNALQAGAAGAPYPVGAASVKEIFDEAGQSLRGYSFVIRTVTGDGGQGRFWYEKDKGRLLAIGTGIGFCAACHSSASADFTYVTVK